MNLLSRFTSLFSIIIYLATIILPQFAYSQSFSSDALNLPVPGSMVGLTSEYNPVIVKGLTIDPSNALKFDFIVDPGQDNLVEDELKKEADRLIKYFMAGLTIAEKDLWVNLSPYEKNRITPNALGQTELGRDMLAQDYLLKQLSATMTYPEENLGKKFWEKIYNKAASLFGTTKVPTSAFSKIWIVPEKATIYEHGSTAFIVESKLKVMLQSDYVALQDSLGNDVVASGQINQQEREALNDVVSDVVKEVLIPEIEKEINTGKNFANLRQIYNSIVLALWYKQSLKESLLGRVYIDQNKIAGVDLEDKQVKDKIYDQYIEAFRHGVYNYIRKDVDKDTKRVVPRKYFSGGVDWARTTQNVLERISAQHGRDYSSLAEPQKRQISQAATPVSDMGMLNVSVILNDEADPAILVESEMPNFEMTVPYVGDMKEVLNDNNKLDSITSMAAEIEQPVVESTEITDVLFVGTADTIKEVAYLNNIATNSNAIEEGFPKVSVVEIKNNPALSNEEVIKRIMDRKIETIAEERNVDSQEILNTTKIVVLEDQGGFKQGDREIISMYRDVINTNYSNNNFEITANQNGYFDIVLPVATLIFGKEKVQTMLKKTVNDYANINKLKNNAFVSLESDIANAVSSEGSEINEIVYFAPETVVPALDDLLSSIKVRGDISIINGNTLDADDLNNLEDTTLVLNIDESAQFEIPDALTMKEYNINTSSVEDTFSVIYGMQEVAKTALEIRLNNASSDNALLVAPDNTGGINFDPAMLNFKIKRDGNGVPLPLNEQSLENIKIDGFSHIITDVTPIHDLPLILGFSGTGDPFEMSALFE